jgi:hypothetical protein
VTLAGYALGSGSQAGADPTFSAVNGTTQATAVHEIVGSSAFPNYVTGAVDNQYPLAHAHVDNSPFSEATASPADTGPLGQTVATAPTTPPGELPIPPGQAIQQPQYADAKAPPGTGGHPVVVGSAPGPFASATADENTASAQAGILSTTASMAGSGAPAAEMARPAAGTPAAPGLPSALAAWRTRWLSADDAHRFPAPAATTPDGTAGDSASSLASFDPHAGVLSLSSEARLHEASFGSGQIVLKDLHLQLHLTNDGSTPHYSVAVDIGAATVGGVPVTINQDGVAVNSQQVPGIGSALQSADQDLNAALRQSGYQVYAVAPKVTRSAGQLTVDAAGVHVSFVQPSSAPGVPQQKADHVLGQAFGDALALPGTALEAQAVSAGTAAGSTGTGQAVPATGAELAGAATGPGAPATGLAPAAPPQRGAVAAGPLEKVVRNRPWWLLWAYVLWQLSVLGTAASLWWWRQEAAP